MSQVVVDISVSPDGWSDEMGYGAKPTGEVNPPIFVVTHSAPDKPRLGDRFHFVNTIEQALAVAEGKDVAVMGGGQICHEIVKEK